jgi:chorismate mutase/prephenate dehydratase
MSNIESRPSKKREWEYYFFVDFLAHKEEERVQNALKAVSQHCLQLSILGSFPRNPDLVL